MGMFDTIHCRYKLPLPEDIDYNDGSFQTKSLDNVMNDYELREDGSLWVVDFDIEDRSDPNAEGLMRIVGMATRVNPRPRFLSSFTGEVRFYTCGSSFKWQGLPCRGRDNWLEFSAYFVAGKLQILTPIKLHLSLEDGTTNLLETCPLKAHHPKTAATHTAEEDDPPPRPCAVCSKMLECATNDWTTLQPYGGGEVQLIFGYGSCKFDDDVTGSFYRGIICDECTETMLPRLEKNPTPGDGR